LSKTSIFFYKIQNYQAKKTKTTSTPFKLVITQPNQVVSQNINQSSRQPYFNLKTRLVLNNVHSNTIQTLHSESIKINRRCCQNPSKHLLLWEGDGRQKCFQAMAMNVNRYG